MIGHLVRKEVAEHWRAFLLILALQGLGMLMALLAQHNSAISSIKILWLQLVTTSILAATIVMQALFASEIRNKTLLFLEALPISRAEVGIAKLLLAAAVIFGASVASFAFVMYLAASTEPVDLRFLSIVGAKTLAVTSLVFAISFLAAVLGRYRYPLYLTLLIAAFSYEQGGGNLASIPPFSLLGATFATERIIFPGLEILAVFSASTAIIAFGLAVLLLRRGSVAMLLGEKMSHREKVLLACGMLGFLFAVQAIAPEKVEPPYALQNPKALSFSGPPIRLTVSPPEVPPESLTADMERLREALAPLDELFDTRLPPLFIIHREDLDPGRFERAGAKERSGVIVRVNLAEPIPIADLAAHVSARLIDDVTDRRSQTERRIWLRDGFALHASHRAIQDSEVKNQLWLRAAYGARRGHGPLDIDRWLVVREALGEPISSALAWSGVVVLESMISEPVLRALLRESFEPRPPDGLEGWWRSRGRDLPQLLRRHASLDRAAFLAAWQQRLDDEIRRLGPVLDALPEIEGRLSTTGNELSRRVSLSIRTESPLGESAIVTLLWRSMPAIDEPFDPLTLRREEQTFSTSATISVPRPFRSGARLFACGAVYVRELGCEVRFAATRITVE